MKKKAPKKTEGKTVKIAPVKGRPMLHWVGKNPATVARAFPAQLCETFRADNPAPEPLYRSFMESGSNLVIHGDSAEVLPSLLVAGFRHKVDLVYIDPPFDSGADYVRRVKLRGVENGNGNGKIEAEGPSFIEQAQYEDIWANDTYLQFMYERLAYLRELMSERGSIYLHCDWHKAHLLRVLMDEIFGETNFRNDVVWTYAGKGMANVAKSFVPYNAHILFYAKNADEVLLHNRMSDVITPAVMRRFGRYMNDDKQITFGVLRQSGEKSELERALRRFQRDHGKEPDDKDIAIDYGKGSLLRNVWDDIPIVRDNEVYLEHAGYPTQKPEGLLERIIQASSDEDSIVLDCFAGSGTTAVAAETLGRRWIAADINKGAVQTTVSRMQKIALGENNGNGDLSGKRRGFVHYRVNGYDFSEEREWRSVAVRMFGVLEDRKMGYFDGVHESNGKLVKIIEANRPLSPLDIQTVRDEFERNRPTDERDVMVICNGAEEAALESAARHERMSPVNRIEIADVRSRGMLLRRPPEAEIKIEKRGKVATARILDYISPTILARLDIDRTVFDEQVEDFRAQIDRVYWDADHNGEHFNITGCDIPEKRKDLVKGEYKIALPRPGAKVAVKIIDMLGEETVVVK